MRSIWDKEFAQAIINVADLDKKLIAKYNSVPGLIDVVDEWIYLPDRTLLPKLKPFVKVLRNIKPLPKDIKLYRGFDPKSDYQNTMGIVVKRALWNSTIQYNVGDTLEYTITEPLSFSTDLRVASDFGSTVVELLTPITDNYIWLTDELSHIVGLRRMGPAASQREVIILPPMTLKFKIIKK